MREDCWVTLEAGRDLALEIREMRAAVYRGAEGILEALREAMISPMVAALVVVGVDWAEMGERSPWRAASMKDEARCWAVGRSEVLVEMAVRTP